MLSSKKIELIYVMQLKVVYILFVLLSVEEMERLDWSERVRIIMGIAYCLQYLHHDLSPPMIHSSLASNMIFLTDDFAAKVLTFFSLLLFVFIIC